ncbi:hypothetical protein Q3G72_006053 [Acer saccharum]|nr:hypothetical protein Q3G72_006053 [Acer saccharum]
MGSLAHMVEDCNGIVQLYSDGSVYRSDENIHFPMPLINNGVLFKDFLYDKTHHLHLRLYKATVSQTPPPRKLPILVFIHGGGFCVGSRVWPNFQNCCVRLASGLDVLVVSIDYRLAPEHRLPAAMEDAYSVMKWLQAQALRMSSENGDDAWFNTSEVDFDRVFVLGDSSGGNIAHHLAVKLGDGLGGLSPVRVRGYVLLAPFFSGVERTKSEETASEAMLNLDILDKFWRLSLPTGDTRDHSFANPFGPTSTVRLEEVRLEPMLVVAGECELLKDRVHDYANKLKEMGKKIDYVEFERQEHGFFTNDPYSKTSTHFLHLLRKFIFESSI